MLRPWGQGLGGVGAGYWLLLLACSTCLSKELRARAEARKLYAIEFDKPSSLGLPT